MHSTNSSRIHALPIFYDIPCTWAASGQRFPRASTQRQELVPGHSRNQARRPRRLVYVWTFEHRRLGERLNMISFFVHFPVSLVGLNLTVCLFPQTQDFPNLTTFFEAEIIGPKHSFETNKWSASHEIDQRHWSKFQAFGPYVSTFASGSKTELAALASDRDNVFTFMRWKEFFLVPDHTVRVINGASFAGFYYCCYDATSCTLHGYYYHTGSELFQSLHLKPVTLPTSSSHMII
jgi:hypothetical protein